MKSVPAADASVGSAGERIPDEVVLASSVTLVLAAPKCPNCPPRKPRDVKLAGIEDE